MYPHYWTVVWSSRWYFQGKNGSGINIHAAGNRRASLTGNPWSDGCQTVYWGDYVEFGKAVGFLNDKAPDIGSAGKINALGTGYSSSIKVTYILDRSNLPDNPKICFIQRSNMLCVKSH